MTHVSELARILNKTFNWNKARIQCLAQMVKGLIAVKTVNLKEISTSFTTSSKTASSYRRMQRFFQSFHFDLMQIVSFIFDRFSLEGKCMLAIDRTNWKFGKTHLNLLVISIVYEGIAIPIYWKNLSKGGSSSTDHRMYAMIKTIYSIGKTRIHCLLADREFIGLEWMKWLVKQNLQFAIRIKENTLLGRHANDRYPTNAHSIFRYLPRKKRKYKKQLYYLKELPVYLCASRSPSGELLILVTMRFSRTALSLYKKRWEIETLFGCLKTKGFNLEDTHLTGERLEKLLFVVVLSFCWAYLAGLERAKNKPIIKKKHGRNSTSLFRYGYDLLRKALFQGLSHLEKYFRYLDCSEPRISYV